jgi:hypothetical protein
VYWPDNNDHKNESLINIMSLVGALVGQLLFGYLADRQSLFSAPDQMIS